MAISATDNTFYVGPWTFEITGEAGEEKSGNRFSFALSGEKHLAQITAPGFHFRSIKTLRKCVELAFQKKGNLSTRVDESKSDTLTLVLIQRTDYEEENTLSLDLAQVSQTVEDRLEYISQFISIGTKDRLSTQDGCKHPDLTVFHNGLTVVRHTGGSGHVSVSTGKPFSSGKHYFEIKVVRCLDNHCMIGVQSALNPLTPYAGLKPFDSGKSLYGYNGHCYYDNTNSDYGLGGFVPGDYVGLHLDMDAKTVTFFINGRGGAPRNLAGTTYYFVINVYSVGDTVELLPQYCAHQ